MSRSDYQTLKFTLEGLAIDDKIPIKHSMVLQNCQTNSEGNVVMDVSDYTEEHVDNIVEEFEPHLEVERRGDELIFYGSFGTGPDMAPY